MADITPVFPIVSSSEVPGGILNSSTGGSSNPIPSGTIVQPTANSNVGGMQAGPTSLQQGSGNDIFRITQLGIQLGGANWLSAPFTVDMQGNMKANAGSFGGTLSAPDGTIGGWIIGTSLLKSADTGARIELNKGENRISVFDGVGEKVVMGYLSGLAKHDGSGNWGSSDYGFWIKTGNTLNIDGDSQYISGTYTIQNDANYLIKDGSNNTIVRLGTDTGEKGLFIYNTSGTILAKYISDKIYVGDVNKYLEYTVAGGLKIKGEIILTNTIPAGSVSGLAATATSSDFASVTGATKPANNADVTLSAINGGLAVTGGGITLSGGGAIKGGQTDYNTGTGFFLGYSGGAYKFSVGSSTSYLAWSGSEMKYTGTTRTTFKLSTIFENINRFVTYGTVVMDNNDGCKISRNATPSTDYSAVEIRVGAGSYLDVYNNTQISLFFICGYNSSPGTSGNNGIIYAGSSSGTDLVGNRQYGFKAVKTNGVITFYCTSSNGSNEQTTSLGVFSYTAIHWLLTAVCTSSAVYFYKEGVLVATHTTYIPAAGSYTNMCTMMFCSNLNTAYEMSMMSPSLTFEKFNGFS